MPTRLPLHERRFRVIDYLHDYNLTPLEFIKTTFNPDLFESNMEKLNTLTDINELLIQVLYMSSFCASGINGVRETSPGRFRSSLDIWRHINYVSEKYSIFDVMNSLYTNRDSLYGQYCGVVHRRVFKLKTAEWHHLNSIRTRDEYKLSFIAWEKINE